MRAPAPRAPALRKHGRSTRLVAYPPLRRRQGRRGLPTLDYAGAGRVAGCLPSTMQAPGELRVAYHPPRGRPVKALLAVCSRTDRLTDGSLPSSNLRVPWRRLKGAGGRKRGDLADLCSPFPIPPFPPAVASCDAQTGYSRTGEGILNVMERVVKIQRRHFFFGAGVRIL